MRIAQARAHAIRGPIRRCACWAALRTPDRSSALQMEYRIKQLTPRAKRAYADKMGSQSDDNDTAVGLA